MKTTHCFWAFGVLLLLSPVVSAAEKNIVLFVTDDQRLDTDQSIDRQMNRVRKHSKHAELMVCPRMNLIKARTVNLLSSLFVVVMFPA